MEGRIQKLCVSQVHAQRRVLRIERTFMGPEYGSTSRKDAFSKNKNNAFFHEQCDRRS